jgi:hypothetical protein
MFVLSYSMKIITPLVILFSVLTCTSKNDIDGHWVSIEKSSINTYSTIDIVESTFWYNKNCLTNRYSWYGVSIRRFKGNQYEIPYYFLSLKDDTLITMPPGSDVFFPQKFVRKKQNFEDELFCDLGIDIDLPVNSTAFCQESVTHPDASFISIGKVKWKKDSVAIQASDVFIGLEDISVFLNFETYKLEVNKNSNHKVVLSIHEKAPTSLILDVIKSIRQYDRNIEIVFSLIDGSKEKVCFVDSISFYKSYLRQ